MWYMHEIGWGWWFLMSIGMLAFVALIAIAAIALLRADSHGRHGAQPPQQQQQQQEAPPHPQELSRQASASPLTMLKQRLAAGEISVEDYEERRRILEEEPPAREAA